MKTRLLIEVRNACKYKFRNVNGVCLCILYLRGDIHTFTSIESMLKYAYDIISYYPDGFYQWWNGSEVYSQHLTRIKDREFRNL